MPAVLVEEEIMTVLVKAIWNYPCMEDVIAH